ncbi:hypothetical protein [Chengkuizengella axinellae]|uniref:SagB/ThcOx family dehydrogenase n=1 Tax=Chengkuizengella axinellae TaxID=3064388 RepID=A0ABT9ITK4_9BACL|nr:hypothetical protein [Chengkuizengella sp. 2205SS18-9]MDP5272681.1 hypothetical protein [Chengkuizengella sp. 2205SS18-9]
MQYTSKDFLGEMAHYFGLESKLIAQQLNIRTDNYQLYNEAAELDEDELYTKNMLSVNDLVRIESDTTYKIHKGYPSPRSIYPLKMFISLGNHQFVSKDDTQERYMYYYNSNINAETGDILIEFTNKYPSYYMNIKKSLLILEMGHFLFNITKTAELLGSKYKLIDINHHIHLRRIKKPSNQVEYKKLLNFKMKCKYRNSGPFLYPITNVNPKIIHKSYSFKDETNDHFNHLEQLINIDDIRNQVKIIPYINRGNGIFESPSNEEGPRIHYMKLNKTHPYINFIGVSFFVVFLINHNVFQSEKATQYILSLGYLSQMISLNHSSESQYCRPIKSYDIELLESLLSLDTSQFTPYYCLISGTVE